MHILLQRASEALAANDAESLEQLCNQAEQIPAHEAAQYATAILAFQKQVSSARQNVILRQKLLERRLGEEMQWVP